MAESVDALVSNTSGAIRAGSTPALGTIKTLVNPTIYKGLYIFDLYIVGFSFKHKKHDSFRKGMNRTYRED